MKKIVCLFLTIALLLTMAACNAGEPVETEPLETGVGSGETKPAEQTGGSENTEQSGGITGELTAEVLMKAPASAESDFEVMDFGEGIVMLTAYTGDSDIVVIPESINGMQVTHISKYIFANNDQIKAIRLSDTIEVIEEGAFALSKSIEIVICGKGLREIGEGAFQACSSLHTVVLNDGLITICGISFGGCESLTEMEIPESVTDIQPMTFYNRPENFKIVGKAGSVAEQYATSEGIPFEAK